MKSLTGIVILFTGIVFASGFLFSCKTTQKAAELKLKPLSTGKILRNIEDRAIGFDRLSVKHINCQVSGPKTSSTFRANLKMVRNEKMLTTFSKLNIPVGRVLLTPDSVVYVNYLEKNFFRGDYSLLQKAFNVNIDFTGLQAILFNDIINYISAQEETVADNMISWADSGRYVIQIVNDRKQSKQSDKARITRNEKYPRKKNDEQVIKTAYVDPVNFNILKFIIEDKANERKVVFDYDDFSVIDGRFFPGAIEMAVDVPQGGMRLGFKLGGISTEDDGGSFEIKIPERYSEMQIK